jgi:hypothetical protein
LTFRAQDDSAAQSWLVHIRKLVNPRGLDKTGSMPSQVTTPIVTPATAFAISSRVSNEEIKCDNELPLDIKRGFLQINRGWFNLVWSKVPVSLSKEYFCFNNTKLPIQDIISVKPSDSLVFTVVTNTKSVTFRALDEYVGLQWVTEIRKLIGKKVCDTVRIVYEDDKSSIEQGENEIVRAGPEKRSEIEEQLQVSLEPSRDPSPVVLQPIASPKNNIISSESNPNNFIESPPQSLSRAQKKKKKKCAQKIPAGGTDRTEVTLLAA